MCPRNKSKNQRFSMVMLAALGGSIALMAFLIWHSDNESPAVANDKNTVVIYRKLSCGCCGKWVKHLQDNGFAVEVHNSPDGDGDGDAVRDKLGVPAALGSCHTATVNGYVIEGHAPAEDIRHLLADKPRVMGLAVPGMEGPHPVAYNVMAFSAVGSSRYSLCIALNRVSNCLI